MLCWRVDLNPATDTLNAAPYILHQEVVKIIDEVETPTVQALAACSGVAFIAPALATSISHSLVPPRAVQGYLAHKTQPPPLGPP